MKTKIQSISIAVWLATSAALVITTGCAGDRYRQSTGEHIDDKATSVRVKSALGDDTQYKDHPVPARKTRFKRRMFGTCRIIVNLNPGADGIFECVTRV